MGNSFLVVNPAKREFIDPFSFGDNEKTGGYLLGYHAMAVASLVCPPYLVSAYGLEGSWARDELVVATEAASPDQYGLTTGTPEFPGRNLYRMVLDEFKDISHLALAMLCERSEEIRDDLTRRAKSQFDFSGGTSTYLLRQLGRCVFECGCGDLDRSLCENFDENWQDIYERLSSG